jgi:REP element-mobilizing transposase RayT
MDPRWRSRWPEGYYHVYNRGARRLEIFAEDGDRSYFMHLVARAATRFAVTGLAWCLVANHYHLLLRACGEALGRMLQEVEKVYARVFNRKLGFNGALFQGRFGATWLPDLEAVTYVTRYIHGNARDEGADLETYPWSSVGCYLGREPVPDWMEVNPVLEGIGGPDSYRTYLRAIPPKKRKADPKDQAQLMFVEFLEGRCRKLFAGEEETLGPYSFPVLVSLAALRTFAIRPGILARYFGFSSGRSISAAVSRMSRRLAENPVLTQKLKGVLTN